MAEFRNPTGCIEYLASLPLLGDADLPGRVLASCSAVSRRELVIDLRGVSAGIAGQPVQTRHDRAGARRAAGLPARYGACRSETPNQPASTEVASTDNLSGR